MCCVYCQLLENNPYADGGYWKYFITGTNEMIAVWYKHEGIMNLSKCKRLLHDMQSRLLVEAKKYFGTSMIKTEGDIDEHVWYKATKIKG